MVFAYIFVFLGVAVMLGIGSLILSGSVMNCENIQDYDPNSSTQSG